ncbi:glycosyl transferase family 2 [Companilactobacillus sp. RD055328]|uniref:glycosyl transferase family 2 n=1 Tax=Companilactobacillus sp. RD055328 TaxID=2916634 RepID=UPI001FC84861|nr:glycosyl transferase family 2 [Companilactobacillus sp. RD055328]GKQ43159.1 glycosyl transferase family 2 [Companilactobacillus sp. RD055328]
MKKVTVIIVTYKKDFRRTPSYEILMRYSNEEKINLFIYDNEKVAPVLEGNNIVNIQSISNEGLSLPYNMALKYAQKNDSEWLLLLDHDTVLTESFLEEVISTASKDVKAILPRIISNENIISPLMADKYISLRHKRVPNVGDVSLPIMAINSGSALSVRILSSIGGFNEEFKLDFLDHWIFWRLNREKESQYIISSEKINHELSVQDINSMSITRYESILNSEVLYYTNYNTDQLSKFINTLFMRAGKQFLLVKNRKFWKKTLKKYFEVRRR